MKKIITIIAIAIFTLMFSSTFTKVSASETTAQLNKTGLGYTINAVKNSYIDVSEIRTGSPIFNEIWLENKVQNLTPDIISTSNVQTTSANNFKDISIKLGASFGLSSSVSGSNFIFNTNSSNGFDIRGNIEYNKYASQYYYALVANYDRYAYTLPNYSSNLSDYRNNLHSDYINAVARLFTINTQSAANSFFDTYGTHLIAKGIYGGRAEIYYSAVSNKIYFGESLYATITKKLDESIKGLVETDQNINFSLYETINKVTSAYREAFRAIAKGGSPFSATSISSLNANYTNWANTIDNSPTLIRTSSDGLVPLWNLLPSAYNKQSYVNKLIEWYSSYVNEYNGSLLSSRDFANTLSNKYISVPYKSVRTKAVLIDDSGRFNHNICDIIDLDTFGLNLDEMYPYNVLKEVGYKTITVRIKMDMCEVNNGYQYICIYNNLCTNMTDEEKDSHKVAPDIKHSYGGSDTETSYSTVYFVFENIPIEKFSDGHRMVLRYGASGKYEDDWKNKNLCIELEYNK